PMQRSLIYAILEKHCKAYGGLYKWQNFVWYLQQQIQDVKQNKVSPKYEQQDIKRQMYDRNTQLDSLRNEFHEQDRLRQIERQIANLEQIKWETKQRIQSADHEGRTSNTWFMRFMRLANAMYTHRTNSNTGMDFLLPKEEARRLIMAYNVVNELNLEDSEVNNAIQSCTRAGHVVIDDLLKVLCKVN
ncbi:unnamed protein product, partial [Didymodactylos carnosus]